MSDIKRIMALLRATKKELVNKEEWELVNNMQLAEGMLLDISILEELKMSIERSVKNEEGNA